MLYKKLFIFLFLLFGSNLVANEDLQRHQKVDGMNVYFGVIPAQIILDHPDMHGGNENTKKYTYHILIALFDSKTDKRISNAKLKATVIPLGMKGKTKELELMDGNMKSYGNYFTMHEITPYTISVEIQSTEHGKISIVDFMFKRPRD